MTWLSLFLGVFAFLTLTYFALLNLAYAALAYLGLRTVQNYRLEYSTLARRDSRALGSYRPISILVPARNEEATIMASIHSYLALDYPDFEVIVVSDGSEDATLTRLIEGFGLSEVPTIFQARLKTAPINAIYRSRQHPRLLVVDKAFGGKSDALNAGLNLARYPLVCAVDADSVLDAKALLNAASHFAEDEHLIAAGGTIRPLSQIEQLERGQAKISQRLPKGWFGRIQVVEYARALLMDRLGWSGVNHLLIISGAFGVFKREAVMKVGGYHVGTVGEDMELIVRLHRHYLEQNSTYRMLFVPEPICWTITPKSIGSLRRQRNRWQRGLWEALWLNRDMLFNPRYGRLGTLVLPYFWLFEGLAPVVEGLGYLLLVVSLLFGLILPEFAIAFLLLTVFFGMLLSQLAIGVETLIFGRYPKVVDRVALLVAIILELCGYRQLLVLERCVATFQVGRRRGQWGSLRKQPGKKSVKQ